MLIAASKLFGSDKRIIRMFNRGIKPGRYDDGAWHSVVLYRDLRVVSVFGTKAALGPNVTEMRSCLLCQIGFDHQMTCRRA